MKKTAVVLVALLVALTAIGLPIWLAVREAGRQALVVETARAMEYARTVMYRSEATASQVATGIARLRKLHARAPCSSASIDEMRQIDLGSSYIQAIGHVRDGLLVCSSMAGDAMDFPLGQVDYRSAGGALFRTNVHFPFAPQRSFIVIEITDFAAIIHKDLPIDVAATEPDVSLAILSLEDDSAIASRGHVERRWLERLGTRREVAFADGGHIVAVVRSPLYMTAAVAAVPARYLEQRSRDLAMRLLPIGLIAGAALVVAILFLARQQMAIPAAIRWGLKRDEFFLEYQPVVALQSGKVCGAEALLRWRRAEGELVSPEIFVPVAEQNHLIVRLTRRVLELVVRDAGSFLSRNPDFHVGINVSPADFHASGLLDSLEAALRAMKAGPANLMLEITERGLLDPMVARETTGTLRRSGFAIAIDDFGTGYSSLSYLESLELDYLKIDRSFIEAIGTGAPTSQVVQHIIRMAEDLGLRMIAEGVESRAQAEFLRQRGVQYAQGWLFGKPMSFQELVRHIEQHGQAAATPLHATGGR
ncbi:EAL domain-containing protein [Massilia niastensis]|uniref:EAL domain-containing protein n=1 Tax=Massilia niastensis TaxID=544911 RepID=UPI0003A26FC9|nr:EAL domain-containing protein [Massilia niastensis]